jgi:hypothetical protein
VTLDEGLQVLDVVALLADDVFDGVANGQKWLRLPEQSYPKR